MGRRVVQARGVSFGGLVGVAAIPLFLVAGPWVAGVAVADSGDADTSATSAEGRVTAASPARRGPGRAGRVAVPGAPGALESRGRGGPGVSSPPPIAASKVRIGDRPVPAAAAGRKAAVRVSALPTGALFPSTDVSVTAPAAAVNAAAAVRDWCGSCWAFGGSAPVAALPTPGQVLNSVGFGLERLLDSVDRWLAGLGGGPITDFLAGAVWLVRSALFPAGGDVAPGGTAACVSTGDCSGQDLTGVDLAGQNLSQVNFTGANLTRALLTGSNLAGGTLTAATLTDARLVGANLSGADVTGAVLSNTNLARANLLGAVFTGADLRTAALTESVNLKTADFTNANLSGQKLVNVDLSGSTLTGANLSKVNFREVDLSGAVVTNANLEGAGLNYVKSTGMVGLPTATLRGSRWWGTPVNFTALGDFSGVDFSNAYLNGSVMTGMDLSGAIFNGAEVQGVSFDGANLTGADFTNALMGASYLVNANLTGADFTWTLRPDIFSLLKANLTGANLTGIIGLATRFKDDFASAGTIFDRITNDGSPLDLSGGYLRRCSFVGADLADANFAGSDLTGANFTDADLAGATFNDAYDGRREGVNFRSANLTGARFLRTNLTGFDLTDADLTGADLTRAGGVADLRPATTTNLNVTRADFRSINVSGKDLTTWTITGAWFGNLANANLSGMNLEGVNLSGAYISGANFYGTRLVGANLSGITDANFVNANWAGADLAGQNLSGRNLSGINLRDVGLRGVDFSGTNLTNAILSGASVVDAKLVGANLNGTDLTGADLLGANLIKAKLTGAIWSDTRCPHGGRSSAGCSAYATQPVPDPRPQFWYSYQAPQTGAIPATSLGGTIGAPIGNYTSTPNYPDGAQGAIKNFSNTTVLVRVQNYYGPTENAILAPGAQVSFQLAAFYNPTLELYRIDDSGQSIGDPAKLWIYDPYVGRPEVQFTPPGLTRPVSTRTYSEGDANVEHWGISNIRLWIKRETDGWTIPVSDEFRAWYGDPNTSDTSDWAIFSIHIDSF